MKKFFPLLQVPFILILVLTTGCLSSCKKFLDEKSDKQLVLPATVSDAQALMDAYSVLNANFPSLGMVSDDNYYLVQTYYNTLTAARKLNYVWAQDASSDADWAFMYQIVLNSNIAIETIEKQPGGVQEAATTKYIKGAAYFSRAMGFYHAAQYFAKPYDAATAAGTPGIPLRLNSEADVVSTRATLEQSWQQIVNDLKVSASLLPVVNTPVSRPSRTAACAMLARVLLDMGLYNAAEKYADTALQLKSNLLNYSTISDAPAFPFSRWNAEVIYMSVAQYPGSFSVTNYKTDSALYLSYSATDLRKKLFFKSNGTNMFGFRGSYDGTNVPFNGLATDEVYLMKAECAARTGQKDTALSYLNRMLVTRFTPGTFVPFASATAEGALQIVLTERRKELIMRDRRWFDLRRLNKEPAFAKTLKRVVGTTTYLLPPNDNRYVYPIPQVVITLTGMEQNVR